MNTSTLFTEEKKNLSQLIFAVKLNIPAKIITEDELKDLKRSLLIAHKHEFGRSNFIYDPNLKGGTIIGNNNQRNILITPSLIQYTEQAKFNNTNVNNISRLLYDFYREKKEVDLTDFKLIGKVFNFHFELGQDGIELLKQKTNLFSEKILSAFNVRVTIEENDKNIHLHFYSENSEDISSSTLFVKMDINNKDQISGLNENSYNDIIGFADDYIRNDFLDLLNRNLG